MRNTVHSSLKLPALISSLPYVLSSTWRMQGRGEREERVEVGDGGEGSEGRRRARG
jgi:hypothetical protein